MHCENEHKLQVYQVLQLLVPHSCNHEIPSWNQVDEAYGCQTMHIKKSKKHFACSAFGLEIHKWIGI
jgi:hypothetical protein